MFCWVREVLCPKLLQLAGIQLHYTGTPSPDAMYVGRVEHAVVSLVDLSCTVAGDVAE